MNCAAIPRDVTESELFGHRRGAFTGALAREGLVTSADGGTLFLDEIGDAPLNVQLALLRLLDAGMIRPVGADRERHVDVHVVAATSAPIEQLMEQGKFKTDLYYRLAQLQLRLPPLRERLDDLADLCRELLTASWQPGQSFDPGTAPPGWRPETRGAGLPARASPAVDLAAGPPGRRAKPSGCWLGWTSSNRLEHQRQEDVGLPAEHEMR